METIQWFKRYADGKIRKEGSEGEKPKERRGHSTDNFPVKGAGGIPEQLATRPLVKVVKAPERRNSMSKPPASVKVDLEYPKPERRSKPPTDEVIKIQEIEAIILNDKFGE